MSGMARQKVIGGGIMRIELPKGLIEEATDRFIDRHPSFTLRELSLKFPWVNAKVGGGIASIWLSLGLMSRQDETFFRLDRLGQEKLLFLDIDGVLNHVKAEEKIDGDCLLRLGEIVRGTGAKIILVSSWRFGYQTMDKDGQDDEANYLDERFRSAGISVADKIPNTIMSRMLGVTNFVLAYNPLSWAILDDEENEYRGYVHERHLVRTSYLDGGLTERAKEEVIGILNGVLP